MLRPIILDTSPLGKLVNPHVDSEMTAWYIRLINAEVPIIIPEIADYELRRKLLHIRSISALRSLDEMVQDHIYAPITTSVMRQAAHFWAQARSQGRPTAAPRELDGDVILAAQALEWNAIVATENVGHLSLFVDARHWREIAVGS